MIEVTIKGGLGNQMFQYAFGREISLRLDVPLILNTIWYNSKREYPYPYVLDKFNIKNSNLTSTPKEVRQETAKGFDGRLLNWPMDPDIRFEGYFQSEGYFKNIRNVLLEELTLKMDILNDDVLRTERAIRKRESIFVHIRRGERTSGIAKESHGLLSKDFYLKAIRMMKGWFFDPQFVCVTDDPDWVKENLPDKFDLNLYSSGYQDYHIMYLMSKCNHAIIPNSAFSWWGAWLMTNPHKIVIGPNEWTIDINHSNPDILPQGWIRIKSEYE